MNYEIPGRNASTAAAFGRSRLTGRLNNFAAGMRPTKQAEVARKGCGDTLAARRRQAGIVVYHSRDRLARITGPDGVPPDRRTFPNAET